MKVLYWLLGLGGALLTLRLLKSKRKEKAAAARASKDKAGLSAAVTSKKTQGKSQHHTGTAEVVELYQDESLYSVWKPCGVSTVPGGLDASSLSKWLESSDKHDLQIVYMLKNKIAGVVLLCKSSDSTLYELQHVAEVEFSWLAVVDGKLEENLVLDSKTRP